MHNAFERLHRLGPRLNLTGHPIKPIVSWEVQSSGRQRGVKGRNEAITRGASTGNGDDAGLPERETNVLLGGLPGRIPEMDVTRLEPLRNACRQDVEPVVKLHRFV